MRRLPSQTHLEWVFIASLIVTCAVLSGFQYHWTSEVGRATSQRLRDGFDGQVELLGRTFDTELLEACNQLLPENEPLTAASRESVHSGHLRRWQTGHPRPLFRRLAIAVPESGSIQLYLLDQKSAQLFRTPWPSEWAALRDNLARKAAKGSGPPFQDSTGTIIEYPLFRDHLENEWMIFELDRDFIARWWLPELVQRFLNQEGQQLSDVIVHPFLKPEDVIYTTGASTHAADARMATVCFNDQGWGTAIRNRRGEDDFWVLTAWQHPAELERLVAFARWRNFALACVVNLLTLSAGLALLRYVRRMRQVSALHIRFVANASHELRTPLTVIRGAGQNLVRNVTNDPARIAQYGRFILQHADQLNNLIERMLELADVRRFTSAPNLAPVSIQDVLEKAVAATLADTRAADCKVEAQIPSHLPRVRGDASALGRVFQNLITNAAKYAASGGWIGVKTELATTETGLMVEVRVEDHGPGIPESEQAHLFEPFARGTSHGEQKIRGSGLGLSMVKEIVQAHRGTVSLRSVLGQGTAFIVRLPVVTARGR